MKIDWKSEYQGEFFCPDCQTGRMTLYGKGNNLKKIQCRSCKKIQQDSIKLNRENFSFFNNTLPSVSIFCFDEDEWDLRAINPIYDLQDISRSIIRFSAIYPNWFKHEVKKYIQCLCKSTRSSSFGSIALYLSDLRTFSSYLNQINIVGFHQINRGLMLNFLAQDKKSTERRLGTLRNFLTTGTVKGWFSIDPDIIRDSDYPKRHRGNPDPLSDKIREQIEKTLHKLPDPIARMWLICYFAAMRPSELALLKQNCLVQDGQYWKLVWHRKKISDYHEVPITRTIAKVVQEQQEYIQNLWGDDWDYLFCHYHNLSRNDLFQSKLEPVKKVVRANHSPLAVAICCLIKSLNICDENGQLAEFSPKLLRSTRLTQLFEEGHDLAVVSAWAGHKHLATTSTYYTQVSCELMEKEAGHICRALVNSEGHHLPYESFPKSFWSNPQAHKLELAGTHINTPIYGACLLPLDQECDKFRACYTCRQHFVATPEKLPLYIKTRDELRIKESEAASKGQEVLVEQFGQQADQLDLIITGLQEAA